MLKKTLLTLCAVAILPNALTIAKDKQDTVKVKDIVITANRTPFDLKTNPGAISVVSKDILSTMPRQAAAEEALRLVPGVRIDNQHNGERIHLSIRGQGILTERGLRGIGVMIDGIPVNDPSGFASDLYDVDWGTVKNIEVLRGPVAGLYGGAGSAGMINITTDNGGSQPIGGMIDESFGSNGYLKSLLQIGGSKDNIDYRISYSRTDGDGHRDHQAYWGNKLYEKINYKPTDKLSITQIVSHIDYFHQNPEGLNLGQFDNLEQANPDARPFNEYQKTNRTTFGLNGKYLFNDMNDVQAYAFYKTSKYKETSNRCAEYRTINLPGFGMQYNFHLKGEKMNHHFSVGGEFKWQDIDMYKLQSGSDPNREESTDETNIELPNLLANQIISQKSAGIYALYKFEFDKLSVMANVRYDKMDNELTDRMMAKDTGKTSKNFDKTTFRFGASYAFMDQLNLFANFSQGFTPPSTEELASNPVGYSGFNTHLIPSTSNCTEFGIRGFINDNIYYDVTAFYMKTEDDFFRFKQSGRGNQEVFYGNAGNSERKGLEVSATYKIIKDLNLNVAYTYSDFKYTSATIDPIYTDPQYVLTTPPADGQTIPNCPENQLYAELSYKLFDCLKFTVATEYQSKWAIYTDAKAYSGQLDPKIYQNWQDGFNLFHIAVAYDWQLFGLNGECSVFARNITDKKYMAFTEPDPDGNSYQPGPGREIFGTIKIKF